MKFDRLFTKCGLQLRFGHIIAAPVHHLIIIPYLVMDNDHYSVKVGNDYSVSIGNGSLANFARRIRSFVPAVSRLLYITHHTIT
jgi:hypothetical protein